MKPHATALQRDRLVVGLGLALITVLAWAYLVHMAAGMNAAVHPAMAAMALPAPPGWDWHGLALAALMWIVMLGAMMLPAATPMVLTFARVHHQRQDAGDGALAPTAFFVAGYLAVWSVFSLAAATGQMALHEAAVLSGPTGRLDALAGGVLLILAGLFQWSPLKTMCLEKCRTPLGFLLAEWREGTRGALVMGLRHGAFCMGCCWALMLLMFVGGVMNLAWMAALAVCMLAEKVLPHGATVGRILGAAFGAAGIWMVGGVALA
ncbi:DUF2182 domain-containing protein [Azoarcus sp. PA01]|nr:DUF2182 domain-containing protein [Azoarcus sp. PA01]